MSIQDDEIVNDPREVAYRRRLAAIRTALGHDHDDATGPQTLDDAIAALCLRHAAALEALDKVDSLLWDDGITEEEAVRLAQGVIEKVRPPSQGADQIQRPDPP